jgi:hypothetical protein
MATEMLRPFDARHDGSLFGEGAGALLLETEASAAARAAPVLGEILGGGYACEAQGLAAIRDDGDGLARAIGQALDDAKLPPAAVGMMSPTATARRSRRFGSRGDQTHFCDACRRSPHSMGIGHTIAAGTRGVLAPALARNVVPGVASLGTLDARQPV